MHLIRNAAVILACISVPVTACEGPASQSDADSPSATAFPAANSQNKGEGSLRGAGWWEAPLLSEPQYASKVIVSEQKGRGDKDLPAFQSNGRDPIRVVIACSGKGSVNVLVDQVDKDLDVNCDEVRTFIDIYTEAGERKITLTSGPDTRWKIAVIQK